MWLRGSWDLGSKKLVLCNYESYLDLCISLVMLCCELADADTRTEHPIRQNITLPMQCQ